MLTPEVLHITLSFMEGLACPRSLTVAVLARHGEWSQLVNLRAEHVAYSCPDAYRRASAATEFLRKYEGFRLEDDEGDPIDLEARAIVKWFWAEEQCFRTNRRFERVLGRMTLGSSDDGRIYSFLEQVRQNVYDVIGSGPLTTVKGRFGPGATQSDKSGFCTIPDKMSSRPTLTPSALGWLFPWMGTAWGSACADLGRSPVFVKGNSFFTVDKDSTQRRSCGKEPSLNVFYQLGLGRALREHLGASGINLKDGKRIHMQVACEASITSAFATIDLTSASDCLAYVFVKYVLPPRWFEALSSVRSPFTGIGGGQFYLEKFSSMGNGYTFELETLIFFAIAQAVVRLRGHQGRGGEDVWVYGDDIIVPTDSAKDLLSALTFCGFTANERKTFTEGPFRESCGGDYWGGEAVRPHYLKEDPNEPHKLVSLANGIRRFAAQDPTGDLSRGLRRAWFAVLDAIPAPIRAIRGPEALGDLVIHDEESRWTVRWRSSIRYVRVYRPATYRQVRWEGFAYRVQMAAALYGITLEGLSNGERSDAKRYLIPRDGVLGYKVGWAPFS